MEHRTTIWAEMSPDVYDGETCDQIRARWDAYADGDMDSDYTDVLKFDSKSFPPGTKIIVTEPECPNCQTIKELCEDDCTFDWDLWVREKYS